MARIESQQLADLQGMKNLLDGIETQLKSIIGMAKSGIPKTATSSKDIDETVKKTNEAKQAFNGLTEAQKQNIIVTQDLNKAKKQFKDQLLAEESAYKKLVNEYGIALQKGKDLAATYGLLDDRTKKATAAALALNNRLKEIDSSMGNNQRKVGDYAGALGSLKDKMLAIGGAAIAAMGISSIGSAITSGIKKAIAYEEELERLKFATEGTTVSFDNLSKFAKEMGGKSLFSTLDILNAEQMAVALGRDEEQTKNMVTAAMGLSRVTGVDLQTAMTQLNMTFSGSVGRLAKYAPEMKNLTEEQLKSGMAVDILAEKMGRFATSGLDTTAGKMKMFEKTWGAIQRAMGDVALKVIVPLIDGLKKVADWIKSNTGAFLTIAKVIAVAGSAILTYTLISNASMIAEKVWTSVKLAWAAAVKAAQVAQTSFNNAAKSNPYGLIAAAIAAVIVAVIAFKDTMTEAQKAQESFKKSMDEEIGASNSLFEQLKKTNVGTKERTDLIVQINEKYGQYLGNIDLEKAGLNEIEAAQNNVNNGLINNILLKEKANTLAAFYAEQAHILVELQKKGLTQKDINDQRDVKNNTWIYQADKEAQSMIESYIQLDQRIKETSDLYDATAEAYRKSFASNNSNPVVKEVKKDSKTAKDKIDKEAEDYEAKIKYWTQRIKDALLQFQDINNKLLIDGKNIDQRIKTNPNSKSEEDYFKEQEDSFQKEMDLADKKINDKIAKEKEMQLQQTKNSESIAKGLEIVDSIEKAYFDKRMNRLDTEIEANKKAQSDMKALADKGNETAIKNLAFEEQQGIKLQAQKEKDQKTKERIEMVMALLKTYNSLMAQPNMTPEEALRKTALSGVMLEGMTKAIGSFYEGTIDTGTTNNPLDKNGGRLSILHDNEIVMPEKEATPLRNMGFENTLQIANAAALYKQQTANNKITTDGNYNYLLAAEIKGLREDMAKRPVLDNVMIDKLNQSVIYSMQVKNSLILNHKKLPKY